MKINTTVSRTGHSNLKIAREFVTGADPIGRYADQHKKVIVNDVISKTLLMSSDLNCDPGCTCTLGLNAHGFDSFEE